MVQPAHLDVRLLQVVRIEIVREYLFSSLGVLFSSIEENLDLVILLFQLGYKLILKVSVIKNDLLELLGFVDSTLEWKRFLVLGIVADILGFPDLLVEDFEELATPALTNEIESFTNIVVEEKKIVILKLRTQSLEMVKLCEDIIQKLLEHLLASLSTL